MQCVLVHKDMYTPYVPVLHPVYKNSTFKAKNIASVPSPSQDEVAAMISELRVRRTTKPLMEMFSLKRQISLVQ